MKLECIVIFYLFSLSNYIIKTKDLSPVAVYNFLAYQKRNCPLARRRLLLFVVLCAIFTKLKASQHPLSKIDSILDTTSTFWLWQTPANLPNAGS